MYKCEKQSFSDVYFLKNIKNSPQCITEKNCKTIRKFLFCALGTPQISLTPLGLELINWICNMIIEHQIMCSHVSFYKKVSERVGAKTFLDFGYFGAKTFLTLSYFEVWLILISHDCFHNLGQDSLKM